LALAAALLACGRGTPATVESTPGAAEATPTARSPTARTPSDLVCEDPPPTELALGSETEVEVGGAGGSRCFWVEVPGGLTELAFVLADMTADMSLYVGYGFLVSIQYHVGEFWQSVESGLTDEAVVIQDPPPGPYFIKVGPGGPSGVGTSTFRVRSEPETTAPLTGALLPGGDVCSPPAAEVSLGEAITDEIVGRTGSPEARRYFCLQVPDGIGQLTIRLSGLTGDVDLFVRRTVPAEWIDRRRGAADRTVTIENPAAGAYFIDVAGAYPGASSPFTLTATAP
jgi:hypothetical protein